MLGRISSRFALFKLVLFAVAQSNIIDDEGRLVVRWGQRTIHAPGALMHPGYMNEAPDISTPTWGARSDAALLMMLDLDAVWEGERVSSIHWLVAGATLEASDAPSASSPKPLNLPSSQISYLRPQPPVGDTAHTYQFYLFAPLPRGFSVPAQYAGIEDKRMPFDLEQFLEDAGLQGTASLIAQNHFRVRNLTGLPTMSLPPPRATESATTTGLLPEETNAVEESTGGSQSFAYGRLEVLSGVVVLLTAISAFAL